MLLIVKLQRPVAELQSSINQERLKLQRPVGELVKQPVSETGNHGDGSADPFYQSYSEA